MASENAVPESGGIETVSDPISPRGRFLLGLHLVGLTLFVFYVLVATWPVIEKTKEVTKTAPNFMTFDFLWRTEVRLPADVRLFFTVLASGALGSLIHTLTSFGDYVGNGRLSRRWTWWFVLRTPIGIGLAMIFYLLLRGGLILPSLPTSGSQQEVDVNLLLNPYGLAAISGLAGMFSKQATDKLREIFDNLFRTERPVQRSAPLGAGGPVISSVTPSRLAMNSNQFTLKLVGENFQEGCTATIDGKSRNAVRTSDSQITVTLLPDDLARKGTLQLIVKNPGPVGGPSPPFPLDVE